MTCRRVFVWGCGVWGDGPNVLPVLVHALFFVLGVAVSWRFWDAYLLLGWCGEQGEVPGGVRHDCVCVCRWCRRGMKGGTNKVACFFGGDFRMWCVVCGLRLYSFEVLSLAWVHLLRCGVV